MNCPECKTELDFISGDFGTGVFAPDGVEEVRYEEGYYCARCGRTFDADELDDDEDPQERMVRNGITEEDIEETRFPTCFPA